MVVARARVIHDALEQHSPEVWDALGPLLRRVAGGGRPSRRALAAAYRRVRAIPFDRAVLERAPNVAVVRGRFAWSDLGSWDALGEHLPLRDGNRVRGTPPVLSLDSRDNIVWNRTDRAVALIGVEGYVVVNTDDALLVCPVDRAQDVRAVVDELRRRGRAELL
jgi:mannose-1-phosphate guanylyltransferase